MSQLAIVSTYFNPLNYRSRRENLARFLEQFYDRDVEVYIGIVGSAPLVTRSNITFLEFEADQCIWSKENLFNLITSQLPDVIDKIIYCDADILFQNPNWLQETANKLITADFVQPFSHVVRLSKGVTELKEEPRPGHTHSRKYLSYAFKQRGQAGRLDRKLSLGTMGYAWAMSRNIIEDVKFYDKMILGGGDELNVRAWTGSIDERYLNSFPPEQQASISQWYKEIQSRLEPNSTIDYVSGHILHLWHGELENRNYKNRYKQHLPVFDPEKDLFKNSSGVFHFSNKTHIREAKKYFKLRKEDEAKAPKLKKILNRLKDQSYAWLN